MAATLMQPPVHRPSMDHTSSFDRQRSPPTAPFASAGFDRAPSPGRGAAAGTSHSRTSSFTSASPSPTSPSSGRPNAAYSGHYFPPHNYHPQTHSHHQHFPPQNQGWPTAALPASSFYAPQYAGFTPGAQHPAYGHGHQQQQAPHDFAAWAHVYQQMVAGGHMGGPGVVPSQHQQDVDDYAPPAGAEQPRRRTASQPASTAASPTGTQQPQPFHPYKRGGNARRDGSASSGGMPRSSSQSTSLNDIVKDAPRARDSQSPPPASGDQRRNNSGMSTDSSQRRVPAPSSSGDDAFVPPRIHTDVRRNSASSQGSSRSGSASATSPNAQQQMPRTASPVSAHARTRSASSSSSISKGAPLTPGGPASNAANAARPSPLSQASALPEGAADPSAPADPKKAAGFRARFKSTGSADAKEAKQPAAKAQPSPTRTEQSTTSRLPAAKGSVPLAPPSAPFSNKKANTSDVSLAETQHTAQTNASAATGKSKRGLFRNKNRSSDNISLSSTVSSASMMIRKMGSLGKLARRNSLMGISKIFKDKPKDDDAALPEKQGGLSFKKKGGRKAEVAPATVSRAYAELDRDLNRLSDEDDRVLSGLTPAAQLARQHTVRSQQAKKEAERLAAEQAAAAVEMGATVGEPTWDRSTTTRAQQQQQQQQQRGTAAAAAADAAVNGSKVVRVVPHQPDNVVHAFAVSQADYDSDDSSDGDTVENITNGMRQSNISDGTDPEFEAMWGKASIDRNARPKRGILKNCVSNEDLEQLVNRQRSNSEPDAEPAATAPGPLSQMPAPSPARIDGNAHAAHHSPAKNGASAAAGLTSGSDDPDPAPSQYDPLSPDFSPFETSLDLDLKPPVIYQHPNHNSSAPTLGHTDAVDAHQARSMTAPVRRRLVWAPECAVYSTYDALTYDRRSEPATCNRLTPELAMAIKQELNAFKLEMPVHPSSRVYTHYFA